MPSSPVETIEFDRCSGSLTRVFWDVVDFPFPKGLGPDLIYQNMKSILEMLGCDGELSIMAYVNKENFGDDEELVDAYNKAGITIIPQRGGRSMLPDIAWWKVEMHNTDFYLESVTSLMVISKKMKKESVFLAFLQGISSGGCYNVLLALPQDPPPQATNNLHTVSFEWLSTMLLDGVNPIVRQTGTLQDRKRKSREESYETGTLQCLYVDAIIPDRPVVESELCTCVFWDIMDFPFDNCYEPGLIYEGMKSDLLRMGCRGEVSIMAYVDTENLGDELLHAYKEAGITIVPLQADIYARAHCMSVDIVLWAMQNPATYFEPRRLLVLSDNVKQGSDFFNALEALEDRYYDVVVAHPQYVELGVVLPFSERFLRPKSREGAVAVGFSNGLASLYNQDFDYVFWDVQGCPTDVSSILPVLRQKGYLGNVSIRPYVDMDYGDDDRLDNCCVSTIRVVTNGDKYAKVTRMLLDILFWAMNYDDAPQNLMLLAEHSKDTKCNIVMQALERRGFNVIFRPSDTIDSIETFCKSLSHDKNLINLRSLEYQGRKVTTETRNRKLGSAVLLWLVDNYLTNPMEIWFKFTSTLEEKGFINFECVMAYIDTRKMSDEMIDVYRKSGLVVRHVPEEDELERITRMSLDMIQCTDWINKPWNLLVISKPFTDSMCDIVLEGLKLKGFNVLFEEPEYMVSFGTSLWSAKGQLGGGRCRSKQ